MSGWTRERFEHYRDKAATTMPALDSYDREIVDYTLQLRDQLSISEFKYNPYRVDWRDKLYTGSAVSVYSTDWCTFDPSLITLQQELKNKLEPDDWKALITSELEFKYVTLPKYKWRILSKAIIPVILAMLPFYAVEFYVASLFHARIPGPTNGLIAFQTTIAALIVFILGRPYRRKAMLEADKRTVSLVGKENLTSALGKVQSALANRSELQKKSRVGPRIVPLSEQERIASLGSVTG